MTSARSTSKADQHRLESAILDAGEVDYLDVWFISRLAEQELGALPPEVGQDLVLAAIRHLLQTGQLRAGDLVPPGEFVAWASNPSKSYERVRSELTTLDRDLQVGDIAWFEVPE